MESNVNFMQHTRYSPLSRVLVNFNFKHGFYSSALHSSFTERVQKLLVHCVYYTGGNPMASNMVFPNCAGDLEMCTPALSRAANFSAAPPFPPATMAPA